MPIGSERSAVQNPFLRYAQEAVWTYLTPDKALDLRRGITSPLLDAVLVEQLQRLNPGVVDAQRATWPPGSTSRASRPFLSRLRNGSATSACWTRSTSRPTAST
jgi:hypothetical protein